MTRLLILLIACGGADDATTCTPASCGEKVYQECVTSGSTQLRYVFGSQSCTCNAVACNECQVALAGYCSSSGSTGGRGGSTGGGGTTTGGGGTTTGGGGTTTGGGGTTTGGGSCRMGGSSCQSFLECCSGTCANRICTTCAGASQACGNGTPCCGGLECYNGKCASCRADGTTCNLASECCSNICHLGTCRACTPKQGACNTSSECCGGLACIGGVCGGPDSQCTTQGALACIQCCQTNHSSGASQYEQIGLNCLCQPNTCQTACKDSLCASGPLDQSCASCFVSSCQATIEAICAIDPVCNVYLACVNACPMM